MDLIGLDWQRAWSWRRNYPVSLLTLILTRRGVSFSHLVGVGGAGVVPDSIHARLPCVVLGEMSVTHQHSVGQGRKGSLLDASLWRFSVCLLFKVEAGPKRSMDL